MAQSLSKILIHLIFTTKNRERVLKDEIRFELHKYIATILKELDSRAIIINSVEDHVHILLLLSKNHSISKIAEEVKKSSSKWIKGKDVAYRNFYWQGGYGAFSVSQSNAPEVQNYIKDQAEHHRHKSFQEEYRGFLNRYEVPFDEKYVWD